MRSSVLSSRGVRPFYILTAPDDYILSLFLCPSSFCAGFSPTSAAAEHNPIREKPKWPPRNSSPPPRIVRLFLPAVLPPLPSASRCPHPGVRGRTRGWPKIISQANGRKELLFQLNTPPPRLTHSLLDVGRLWNSAAVLSQVCCRRLEFLGFPLYSLRVCAFPSLVHC